MASAFASTQLTQMLGGESAQPSFIDWQLDAVVPDLHLEKTWYYVELIDGKLVPA